MSSQDAPITLTKTLVASVLEIIKFYSEKGVFRVNEYKDIHSINERLTDILAALDADKPYEELSASEYGFIVLIFKEGTTRIPTAIDSFGQIFGIYQSFRKLLEQSTKMPPLEEVKEEE